MSRALALFALCLSTIALGCTGAAVRSSAVGGLPVAADSSPPPAVEVVHRVAEPAPVVAGRTAALPIDLIGVEGGCPGAPELSPGVQHAGPSAGDVSVTFGAY